MSTPPEWAVAEATHRHYKGGYYRIVGEAKHTETGERMVVYEHIWPHERGLFCRPFDLFYGVLSDGSPRFEPLTRQTISYSTSGAGGRLGLSPTIHRSMACTAKRR